MRLRVRLCVHILSFYFMVWSLPGFVAHCDMNANICVYRIQDGLCLLWLHPVLLTPLTEQA